MSFQLFLVSPPELSFAEVPAVIQLFEHKLETFHLRKPGSDEQYMREYIKRIPGKFHSRMVLHSHYELAAEFLLKGIHLTEEERKKAEVGKNKGQSISASLHSLQDIVMCKNDFDYVFLSPVFDSISKAGYKSAFKIEELRSFLNDYTKAENNRASIIALGGIDENNIRDIADAGFAGAALQGAVWKQKMDAVSSYLSIVSKIQ